MLYVAMFSKTSSKTSEMTQRCIDSVANAERPLDGSFKDLSLLLVESGEDCEYKNCKTAKYTEGMQFNYNHACNIAADEFMKTANDDDWVCFMNNDVIFSKDCIIELARAAEHVAVDSMCPCIAQIPGIGDNTVAVVGLILKKTFFGCCFIIKVSMLKKLLPFDETFDFYFQDDDLIERLKAFDAKHALAVKAKAKHIGQATTGPEDIDKLVDGAKKFIKKYSLQTYLQREAEKAATLKLSMKQDKE